jgi:hypothetical protein
MMVTNNSRGRLRADKSREVTVVGGPGDGGGERSASLIHVPAGAVVFVQFSSTGAATINAGSTFAGNFAPCPPSCASACPC